MEGDKCLDHLPVYLPNDQIGYLAPLTRMLTPRNAVSKGNCSVHYPIVFEDESGWMVTANPDVRALQVTLSDHHFLNAKTKFKREKHI
jgi:hypothetical protein